MSGGGPGGGSRGGSRGGVPGDYLSVEGLLASQVVLQLVLDVVEGGGLSLGTQVPAHTRESVSHHGVWLKGPFSGHKGTTLPALQRSNPLLHILSLTQCLKTHQHNVSTSIGRLLIIYTVTY